MEAILFCGIQASGKTTFYKQYFFHTHVRIALDLLHTRNKEQQFLHTCFQTHQRFVVDNTNATIAERKKYIEQAKAYKYKVIGYYFDTDVTAALERNGQRSGKAVIPEKGIKSTFKKLIPPDYAEGFDALFTVQIQDGSFVVKTQQKQSDETAE
jgi:predicted kinase